MRQAVIFAYWVEAAMISIERLMIDDLFHSLDGTPGKTVEKGNNTSDHWEAK
jgi:hypothetical protein